ncbi:MAG: hypothetical protein JW724_01800 [Candidatus Altiarchaeota archaeon]|nr:hypothetical protein [Candidatus Altiarchaeota archaeon]
MESGELIKKGLVFGAFMGLACGLSTVLLGWDNYGILSGLPGFFTSFTVLLSVYLGFSGVFIGPDRLFTLPITYILSGALSWGVLGFLLDRRSERLFIAFTVLYVLLWIFSGLFAIFIVAVAYG